VGFGSAQGKVSIPRIPVHKYNGAKRRNPENIYRPRYDNTQRHFEQKLFRGDNRDGIKAASIYISCRLNGCPRTAFEIAEIFNLDKQSATNGCSNAINILQNIERNVDVSQKSILITTLASSFIERFSSKIGLPYELVVLSKFVSKPSNPII
jgi:transcription initiation factor TFIIIB Brf1 subunit/transcription initiation factor TFIIB